MSQTSQNCQSQNESKDIKGVKIVKVKMSQKVSNETKSKLLNESKGVKHIVCYKNYQMYYCVKSFVFVHKCKVPLFPNFVGNGI